MNLAIRSQEVSFSYDRRNRPSLVKVNFEVKPGECILICGASGSGKSTIGRLINGLSPEYVKGDLSGEFYTFDLQSGQAKLNDYVFHVGSVFQNPRTQHFTTNTTSELVFPLENIGMSNQQIDNRLNEQIAAFDLDHLMDQSLFALSGGEKQLLAFVSATMIDPDLYVLDELTSNLDEKAIETIAQAIRYLIQQGKTVIILEHRLAWAKDLVDRYLLLEDGHLKQEWSASEFQALKQEDLYALGLRTNNLAMVKEELTKKAAPKNCDHPLLLECQQLDIGYKKKVVAKDINFTFYGGQIIGLLGPNGVGKSTLAHTLTGLQKALNGKILWQGQALQVSDLLKKSYLVMQDMNYQLFTESVESEIALNAVDTTEMDAIIDRLNLTAYRQDHPMSLSEGQKQRVAIASALVSGKHILIFDEPTSGLDYGHMIAFGQLLTEIKHSDLVMIVITHDEELAAQWCDYVLHM